MMTSLVRLQQGNVKKIRILMKYLIVMKKIFISFNNFNEIFWKILCYENIKTQRQLNFTLSRKYSFGKTTGGSN